MATHGRYLLMKTNSGEIMNKLLKTALVLGTLAGMSGCVVAPPYVAYSEPHVEIIRPAPYYVRPAPHYVPPPYHRPHRGHGDRRWD